MLLEQQGLEHRSQRQRSFICHDRLLFIDSETMPFPSFPNWGHVSPEILPACRF